ncbi:amino acid permease [Emcibacter sp. SYSU 3D8]|uniref:APC family permease n=1 Tax=Emcibacter sp. SYSU 3D8 TaxID=3133969 RepID=UPI0031FE447E
MSDKAALPAEAPRGLTRTLSLTHAVLYGLGVTIGAGIYVLVGVAAGRSGMHAPLAFVGAASVIALSAASFAELGTRMPVSASEAAYVQAAYRRNWLSLAVGLLVVFTAVISAATISVGSAGYIAVFVPLSEPVIVAGVVLFMGVIACLATIQSVTFAGVMTLIEVGGLMLIIGAGFSVAPAALTRLPEMWPASTELSVWIGISGTSLIAVFAFIGFEHLVNIAEEIKDPRRTLPRALFLTLGITAFIYAAVVWVSLIAVPPEELATSSAPLALVFERLTGMPLASMSLIAVVATLNGIIVHMIMIARVIYGLADRGHLPPVLKGLSPVTGTPLLATAIGVGAILLFALVVPIEGLADWTARLTLVIFVIVNLALIRIKRQEAAPPPGAFICKPWVPVAGLISSALLLVLDLFMR